MKNSFQAYFSWEYYGVFFFRKQVHDYMYESIDGL